MVVGSVELLKIYVKTQLQWAYTLWKLCRAVTNMGFEAIYAIVFVYCESPRAAAQGEARRRAVVTRKKKVTVWSILAEPFCITRAEVYRIQRVLTPTFTAAGASSAKWKRTLGFPDEFAGGHQVVWKIATGSDGWLWGSDWRNVVFWSAAVVIV